MLQPRPITTLFPLPGLVAGLVLAVLRPATRALGRSARPRRCSGPAGRPVASPPRPIGCASRSAVQAAFTGAGMRQILPPIYAAMSTRAAVIALLAGVATASGIDETLRGMPHNVTTEMDLTLWRLAAAARGPPGTAAAPPAGRARRPVPRR
jgi:pyruvate,water dikinase